MTVRRIPIAPMDGLMWGLTLLVLLLPLGFVGIGLVAGPVSVGMFATALGLVALYAAIWLFCRPTHFVVDAGGVHMAFPAWTRTVPADTLRGVEVYAGNGFREQVGWGARVGVGGLWGGFGWLVTPKGTFEFYISRVSELVVVECVGRKDLLVSPADPQAFADAVAELVGEAPLTEGTGSG